MYLVFIATLTMSGSLHPDDKCTKALALQEQVNAHATGLLNFKAPTTPVFQTTTELLKEATTLKDAAEARYEGMPMEQLLTNLDPWIKIENAKARIVSNGSEERYLPGLDVSNNSTSSSALAAEHIASVKAKYPHLPPPHNDLRVNINTHLNLIIKNLDSSEALVLTLVRESQEAPTEKQMKRFENFKEQIDALVMLRVIKERLDTKLVEEIEKAKLIEAIVEAIKVIQP